MLDGKITSDIMPLSDQEVKKELAKAQTRMKVIVERKPSMSLIP